MPELSIYDQIDIVLTSLFTLSHGPQSAGRAKRIRTQVVALRQLCEAARVQESKKSWWQRIKEWRFLIS